MEVFLSPHFDDAVFSCGGRIYQSASGQGACVITVFGGYPDSRNQRLYVNRRRQEDKDALTILSSQRVVLDFPDAVFRSDSSQHLLYMQESDLFGPIHSLDVELIDQIAWKIESVLEKLCPTKEFVPLSLGSHVDHKLVRASFGKIRKSTSEIYYYEDFPYCDPNFHGSTSETSFSHKYSKNWLRAGLSPTLTALSQHEFRVKIRAVRCYASQSDFMFGANAEEIFGSYAKRISTSGYLAERYWSS